MGLKKITQGHLKRVEADTSNLALGTNATQPYLKGLFLPRGQTRDKPGTTRFLPMDWKKPKIYRGKTGAVTEKWHVEYAYRDPEKPTSFPRRKVYELINTFDTLEDKERYAQDLRDAIEFSLRNGYNPYSIEQKVAKAKKHFSDKSKPENHTVLEALTSFMDSRRNKGLRQKSIENYQSIVNMFRSWVILNNLHQLRMSDMQQKTIENFLQDTRAENKWTNTTYNNYVGFLTTIFNYCLHEGMMEKSPIGPKLGRLREEKKTHRYYSSEIALRVKEKIVAEDPYLFSFCEFIYYTCVRPGEAMKIQLKHIDLTEKRLFIPANISKTGRDGYVPLADELLEKLKGIRSFPHEYYLFSTHKAPGPHPVSKNFFSYRFNSIKTSLGLSPEYTIYGWKHTRNVHLANDGVNPYDIMKLNRHSDLGMTMNYLRDLGTTITEDVQDKTRRF